MTKKSELIKGLLIIIHRLKIEIREIEKHCRPILNGETFMDHEEVCEILHVSRRTLQQYRDDGVIPYIQLPGKVIYKESDIIRVLEKNYNGTRE